MRTSWGGLLVGMVGLAVLDGVLSRRQATSNVAGVLTGAGGAVRRFLDPTVPLFSTKASTTAAVTSTASSSSTSTAIPTAIIPGLSGSAPAGSTTV